MHNALRNFDSVQWAQLEVDQDEFIRGPVYRVLHALLDETERFVTVRS